VSTAPFSWALTDLPASDYSLTAVALDNRGTSTTSAPVNFTVVSGIEHRGSVPAHYSTTQEPRKSVSADGYELAGDVVGYPGYASVAMSGAARGPGHG
jgi:hypothetical protein